MDRDVTHLMVVEGCEFRNPTMREHAMPEKLRTNILPMLLVALILGFVAAWFSRCWRYGVCL